ASMRLMRRLTMDFDMPRRRAARPKPLLSTTSTKLLRSTSSTIVCSSGSNSMVQYYHIPSLCMQRYLCPSCNAKGRRRAHPMSNILVLTTSALAQASASNALVGDAMLALRQADPLTRIVTRDLGTAPIPHLSVDSAAALTGAEPANAAQAAARALSDE